ncbi:MAG TPA: DUF2752 domain-containing protein [Candidatus Limnocylindrales bacterium]|nr:DUF2752 domain-containing protein [Candidatus Limnocylindrales bacterium]
MKMSIHLKYRAHAAAGLLLAGCGILFSFPPAEYHFYPLCPFYALTHLLCPGCGGTRALYYLLHLNLAEALHYNALVTVLAPPSLLWLAFCYYAVLRHGRAPGIRLSRTAMAVLFVVVLLFAVVRDAGIAFVI